MKKKVTSKQPRSKALIVFAAVILIAAAVMTGWLLGHRTSGVGTSTSSSATQPAPGNAATSPSVKSLVSYTLPAGWTESTCATATNTVYIVPAGTVSGCNAPITIYVDSQNTTDCRQIQPDNAQNQVIRDHTCLSLYIDGHKSLKALTEYSTKSTYKTDTTFSDYFINTGQGVVKVEYTYTSANEFQDGFDQLATSVQVK